LLEATMTKGGRTRQRIIEQAAPLFNRQGFAGCSMQDVLDATGLEKGGVYRHFAGKEELAAAVFAWSLKQAVKTRTDGLDQVGNAVERLKAVIRRFVETPSPVAGGCPLLNTAVDADDGNATLRRLVRKAFADWRRRVGELVTQGVAAGEIRQDADPARVADTIIAALEGGLVLSRLDGNREALGSVETMLGEMLERMRADGRRP
jgi:TetR/AcrR family transcriptional regulator, transcriptional repressor for nem operon